MAEVKVIRPESINVSYDQDDHKIKLDSVTINNESDKPLSAVKCSIVLGRGADIIQTLRDDIQITVDARGQYKIPSDKLSVELPSDLEKIVSEADGKDYYIAIVFGPEEEVVDKFSLKKVIATTGGQVSVKGVGGGTAISIEEVVDTLKVQFPHAVSCEVDLNKKKATIGRIELKNTGSKTIPGGWRAKICILSGIDRRFTMVDSIVLPTLMSKITAPIGPFEGDVPKDITRSEDEWSLELYIVDPQGNHELLFRSPSVSFV